MKNIFKFFITLSLFTVITACSLFGPNVTGVWEIPSGTNSKMTLQQNGSTIQGYAYYNGQNEGAVIGQIDGNNITLQIRRTTPPNTVFTGVVSDDGVSMQLKSNTGQTLTMFKSR